MARYRGQDQGKEDAMSGAGEGNGSNWRSLNISEDSEFGRVQFQSCSAEL